MFKPRLEPTGGDWAAGGAEAVLCEAAVAEGCRGRDGKIPGLK